MNNREQHCEKLVLLADRRVPIAFLRTVPDNDNNKKKNLTDPCKIN